MLPKHISFSGVFAIMLPLLFSSSISLSSAARIPDWLVTNITTPPTFTKNADGTYTLSNGLISRTFSMGTSMVPGSNGFGTVDFYSNMSQTSLLRAIDCEGYITLNETGYSLGGLIQTGTYYHAYLNRSADGIQNNPNGWDAISYTLGTPQAPFPWTPGTRGSPTNIAWPPIGLQVAFTLQAPASAPASHRQVQIQVVYEMYPGIPLLTKWITVTSIGAEAAGLVITSVLPESLRLAQQYTPCSLGLSPASAGSWSSPPSQLYIQTDAAHSSAVEWITDGASPADPGAVECQLLTNYTLGPGVVLLGGAAPSHRMHPTLVQSAPTAEFVSFRTFEIVLDTYDVERTGLAIKRLYKLWAPHTLETMQHLHLTDTSDAGVQLAVDQCNATGFDMILYSFGSGFNLETNDTTYIEQIKNQIAYAHSKGIEVGGYDLICLDRGFNGYGGNVGVQWDRVLEDGTTLGMDACFGSGWVDLLNYYAYTFINVTGLSMLETDGPYGGGSCASHTHAYHLGESDSIYQQTQVQARWYAGLRSRNIFINAPDNYQFQGSQRTGMGYDEDQYSLPRWQDVTVSRMTVYDQSYAKLPTGYWMQTPLIDYHGGGADAAFEPMSEHLPEYEMSLAQYLGGGVASCYRGTRLYDTNETQAVVTKWMNIFKTYRDVITSEIVHVRRPDGQSLDSFMHVNPFLPVNRGFALVFNPTLFTVTQDITFNLYYTGLNVTANFSQEGATPPVLYTLERDYTVTVSVTLAPQSVTWYVITDGGQ